MRLSKETANLTGWKAVGMAVLIVAGVGSKVYRQMNRGQDDQPPPVANAPAQAAPVQTVQRGEDLVIRDSVRVPTPAGFKWQPPKSLNVGDIPAEVYVAESADRPDQMDLLLLKELPQSRTKFLEAMRDSYVSGAQQQGAQLVDGQIPPIPAEVPDQFRFVITFAPAAGYHNEMYFAVVFGKKQVYFFQAHSPSRQAADQLLDLVAGVTEDQPAGASADSLAATPSTDAAVATSSIPIAPEAAPPVAAVPEPSPAPAAAVPASGQPDPVSTGLVQKPDAAAGTQPASAKQGEWTTVQLPGPVYDCAIGGEGRLMILPIQSKDEAVVFDVADGKIVATIAVPQNSLIAAGKQTLLVISPADKKIVRYSLPQFAVEKTGELAIDGKPLAVAMGAASAGPALLQWHDPEQRGCRLGLLNPDTFEVRAISRRRREGKPGELQFGNSTREDRLELRASAESTVFTIRPASGTTHFERLFVGRKLALQWDDSRGTGHLLPSADGKYLCAGNGLITGSMTARRDRTSNPCYTTTDPRFYMVLDDKQLAIHEAISNRPVYVIPEVAREFGRGFVYASSNGNRDQPFQLMLDQRLHCVPQAGALVTICEGDEQLRIRRLPVSEFEMKSPDDPNVLHFASRVSRTVAAGAGRYLIAHTPERGEAVVVDLVDRKQLGTVPATNDALIAGGLNNFIVLSTEDKSVSRFALPDLSQQQSSQLRLDGQPLELARGSGSIGPALLFWTPDGDEGIYSLLNAESFGLTQLSASRTKRDGGLQISQNRVGQVEMRAGADGQSFGLWHPHSSPTGLEVVRIGSSPQTKHEHSTAGHVIPTIGGRVLTAVGNFANDLVTPQDGRQLCFPTTHPSYMLVLTNEGGQLRETLTGKVVAPIPAIQGLGDKFLEYAEYGKRPKYCLAKDERIYCIPTEDSLAVIPETDDRIVFQNVSFGLPDDVPSAIEVLAAASTPMTAPASSGAATPDGAPASSNPEGTPSTDKLAVSDSQPEKSPAKPAPGPTAPSRNPKNRTWSDKTGKFKIEARLISIEDEQAVLRKADGKIIKVPLEKLSDEDNEFVSALRKKK